MVMVKCAVYDRCGVFAVEIQPDSQVGATQQAILEDGPWSQDRLVGQSDFKVYLARDLDGNWLDDGATTCRLLRQGIADQAFEEMRPAETIAWCLGDNFSPMDKAIQVLVELPNKAALVTTPSSESETNASRAQDGGKWLLYAAVQHLSLTMPLLDRNVHRGELLGALDQTTRALYGVRELWRACTRSHWRGQWVAQCRWLGLFLILRRHQHPHHHHHHRLGWS